MVEKYTLDQSDEENYVYWSCINDRINYGFKDFEKYLLTWYKYMGRQYNVYKPLLWTFDNLYGLLWEGLSREKNGEKILFYSFKYKQLISSIQENNNAALIVNGKKDRFFALSKLCPYFSDSDLYGEFFRYHREKNPKYINSILNTIQKRLSSIRPSVVILPNDSLPIERAIVLSCRRLNIPTVFIQHGIYQSSCFLLDGLAADYVLVWGNYFKKMYQDLGVNPDRIFIVGYPYKKTGLNQNDAIIKGSGKLKVYYLGQNYEEINSDYLEIKRTTLTHLNNFCKMNGVDFIYRPHPRDDRDKISFVVSGVSMTPYHESLDDSIRKGDIFISFNSTSLVEAAMKSRFCLQLRNYPIEADNFENLGICQRSFDCIEDLELFLKQIISNPESLGQKIAFNNDYIDLSLNPDKRLMQIIHSIIENHDD